MLNVVFIHSALGQDEIMFKNYNQKDLEKNKIFENTYNFWWTKNNWNPFVYLKDTIPYFVDDRNYKGVINYGVEFHSKDFRTFTLLENKSMYFLKVDFESCKFNIKDKTIEIEGYVSGGWGNSVKTGLDDARNYIDVFIGEKIDTTSVCYYDINVNEDYLETKWKNKVIDDLVVLDTFPSFYLKDYSYFRTESKGKRPFMIKGKINKNTILSFGGASCYAEIFDIGSMVFVPNKNSSKRTEEPEINPKPLIINNKLVSEIEKEKAEEKNVNYYTYTESAENYILGRQYAKAKETYLVLDKEYPTLYARDVHNAIRCAILSRDYENAFYWGRKLANKGINEAYFNATVFNNLKKNVGWKNFSITYDSLYKANQKKLNFTLRQQLDDLVVEDQNEYGLSKRKEPKILFEKTEIVTDKLIFLIEKNGFPSEEKIGVHIKNDTTLIVSPDYNVLIRHAIQQKTEKLTVLNKLLDESSDALEYDAKRSPNNISPYNSCIHIYKGNLYNSKSCGNNDLMVRKIVFKFKNRYNFIIDNGNYIISEYNKQNPDEDDKYYEENFDFIIKLTDDWDFYEK